MPRARGMTHLRCSFGALEVLELRDPFEARPRHKLRVQCDGLARIGGVVGNRHTADVRYL